MIRCWMGVALAGLLLAPALADDAADARAVVEKGIKAMGYTETLDKPQVHTWKSKGKITMMGQTTPYTCDYVFRGPDRFRFVMDAEFGGQKMHLVAAGSGGKAWEQMSGAAAQDVGSDKLKEFNHEIYSFWVCMLTSLRDPGFQLSSIGETKGIDGQTHVGVKVKRAGQRDINLFFDKTTGLLMRYLTRVVDETSNKEVNQEVRFTDYKTADGGRQFGKITILRDGKPFIDEELYDYKRGDKLDEALFKKP
jgi:hypothetical protein